MVGGGGGVWLRWDDDVCFDLERSCLFFDGGERGTAVGGWGLLLVASCFPSRGDDGCLGGGVACCEVRWVSNGDLVVG